MNKTVANKLEAGKPDKKPTKAHQICETASNSINKSKKVDKIKQVKQDEEDDLPIEIDLKKIVDAAFKKTEPNLNQGKKWPLILDKKNVFSAFSRLRESKYVHCSDESHLDPEELRWKILTAYFHGYVLVIDLGSSNETLKDFSNACDEIEKNLYSDLMNKVFVADQNRYKSLIKESDGDQFDAEKIQEFKNFLTVLLVDDEELALTLKNVGTLYIIK